MSPHNKIDESAPKEIWLVIGEEGNYSDSKGDEFCEICWCDSKQGDHDVKYIRHDLVNVPDIERELQSKVKPWLLACFGENVASDIIERNHRFLEESLELVQSKGLTASEAHQLVDYVFNRPVGEPYQEVGGVMITLAALCLAAKLNMHDAGETELKRIWTKIDQIRQKQAAKPKHSPLPM